jgi:CRP-like cAMP-binding protein
VTLKAGVDPLANLIEPSMLVVLTGTVAVTRADGTKQTADSGDTIGMYQALSGKPLGATLAADGEGTALRFTRTDLFDVLADETALIQSVFAGLLRAAESRSREPQPA